AVQVGFAARFEPRNGHTESHHVLAIERAEHLPSDFRRNDEQPQRDQIDILESPDLALQADDRFEILALGERTNLNHCLSGPSCALASCQSVSICSSVAPGRAACFSTCAKRLRNFALVFRRACSGSTFSNRARFT